jgi:uncharacterized membrane protein
MILVPVMMIVFAWLGRRDIMRAVIWAAALSLIAIALDIITIGALLRLQQGPYMRTLAGIFTMQGLYSVWGALDQLAVAGQLLVGALSLVAAAQRGQWRWFTLLAVCATLASIAHGVLGDASLLTRNIIPLAYLSQAILFSLIAALLPLFAWMFAAQQTRRARVDVSPAENTNAPSAQM